MAEPLEPSEEQEVRRAVPADAGAMADLWLRSRRASVPRIPPPAHDEEDVRKWIDTVVAPGRQTWVVESGGRVVAMLALEPGWIDQLYADPDVTGRGIGSRLVAVAKAAEPDGLDLWTFAANLGARRFYERHGFVAVAWTDGDNEEGAPDVRYHWPAP